MSEIVNPAYKNVQSIRTISGKEYTTVGLQVRALDDRIHIEYPAIDNKSPSVICIMWSAVESIIAENVI